MCQYICGIAIKVSIGMVGEDLPAQIARLAITAILPRIRGARSEAYPLRYVSDESFD